MNGNARVRNLSNIAATSFTGALLGDLFWALALLIVLLFEFCEDFGLNFALIEMIAVIFYVVAMPVGIGGWLFVWGDNGPPYAWMETAAFTICFGLAFYGVIGVVVGALLGRKYRWRVSTRTMAIAFTIIILAIGLAVSFRV